MEDKTRSRNRRDPSLGCSECFGRARQWKTRQDSRSKTMKDKTKTRFLRACAIEMHLDIAQELVRKDHAPRFVPACAVEMHVDMSQEPLNTAIYREKCPNPEPRRKLCASLRSRNALGQFTRATSHRNLQEKCPSPKPGHILCASLRSRNALGQFTRGTLYRNLQEKMPQPRTGTQTLCERAPSRCTRTDMSQ